MSFCALTLDLIAPLNGDDNFVNGVAFGPWDRDGNAATE
jgi:hypothetical protein